MIPTIADPPPKVGGKEIQSEQFQNRSFSLLSIASISGCCEVKIALLLFPPLLFPVVCFVSLSMCDVYMFVEWWCVDCVCICMICIFEKVNKCEVSDNISITNVLLGRPSSCS